MEAYMLSWEAASERLLDAAALPAGTRRSCETVASKASYWAHWTMGVNDPVPIFDVFRTVTGAGPKIPWDERFQRSRRNLQVTSKLVGKAGKRALSGASEEESGAER
jgi:hypothetical protein